MPPMVIDAARGTNESVFALFATRARRRAVGSLARQLIACTLTAVFIMVIVPWLWPVASALAAAACYAAWGLLDRREPSRLGVVTMRVLAGLAAALVISVCVGV